MNILKKFLPFLPFTRTAPNFQGPGFFEQKFGQGLPVWIKDNLEEYINKGYTFNADLYAIINYIITTAASVPFKLYTYNDKGEMKEQLNHPIIDLLDKPSERAGYSFFIQQVLGFKLITGNVYIWLPRLEAGAREGQTNEMHVLPSQWVEIVGSKNEVDYYKIINNEQQRFNKEDIIHLRTFNPDYENGQDFYGLSPIRAAARLVTQSNDAYTANVKAFQNMGAMGILTRKGDQAFTKEQAQNAMDYWKTSFGGSGNYNKIHITSAQYDWIKLGLSPIDLNILESQKMSFRQLCNIFKFPSQLLNDNEASTFNNVREAKKAVYTDIIIPELKALRDELNRQLLPSYGANLYLDLDLSGIDVLQDNRKEQVEWLERAWWIPTQTKQRIMGIEEDPTLPKYLIPSNLVESDNLGEELIREAEKMINLR